MKSKTLTGLLCASLAFAASFTPRQATAQAQKNPWASEGDIPWGITGVNGPGTSIKVLLSKENGMIDNTVRALYKVKVDPGGTYTVAAAPDEDRIFFVTVGQGRFTLGDEQIETKPGDVFGVPAGVKHGLANTGKDAIEMIALASPLTAPNPSAKPRWARTEDQPWTVNKVHGPGCEERSGLRGGFSTVIAGLWLMKVPPHGINYMHTGNNDHQLFYIWAAATPDPKPRDSRTYAARWLIGDKLMQTKVGDVFYAHGGPTPMQHGTLNESPETPLIYVAFGVNVPGARPPSRAGAPPATGLPARPGT
jgi:mannose-6-phosphate isomerase-like protein (cupin superfamily)